MSHTQYDTFSDGIGITTLASDRGTVEGVQEDSPIAINGVALPEGTVLEGGQGVRHFYPPEMAERAADQLQQQLDDDETTVHIVKNFHELEGQAPADDIIGEVTGVGYERGVGVRFAGEITDTETAEKIQLGYLDVSPTVGRALGDERDAQMDARPVADVAGFRDIAIVGQGQPGADVGVGANPAIEALARTPVPDGDTTGGDDDDDSGDADDSDADDVDGSPAGEDPTEQPAGDDGTRQSTDGPAQSDDQSQPDAMTDDTDLSDEEQALLAAVDDPSEAIDVLRDYHSREEPTIIDSDTLETLRDEVAEAKEAFAAVIAEQSPQSADALARQDMAGLTEPFRDDDGDIDVDTLQQTPETQSGGGDPTPDNEGGDGGTGGSDGFDPDALSLSEREELQRLHKKRSSFEKRGVDSRVDATEAQMADIADVEDYDEIEMEAL
jgi:hypothetical protein